MNQAESCRMERIKGASIGATIVGGFGAAWLAIGMTGAGVPGSVALAVVVPGFVFIAGLGLAARRGLSRQAGQETPGKREMMRAFIVVNVVQWVAIFGTVNLLRNFHLDGWIIPAIVLIVGAHFLPLAQIFQAPQHRMTGIALMLCAAVAVLLPGSVRDVVECVAAGMILWVSAAAALYGAFRMAASLRLYVQAGRGGLQG